MVYALIVVYRVGQLICQVARGDATYQRKRKRGETERLSTRFDHFYHLPRQTLCPDLLHSAQCTVGIPGAKMKSSDKMLAAERFTGFSFCTFPCKCISKKILCSKSSSYPSVALQCKLCALCANVCKYALCSGDGELLDLDRREAPCHR